MSLVADVAAADTTIVYDGRTDDGPLERWQAGGRARVAAEVFQYTQAEVPGTRLGTATVADRAMPAASATILLSTIPAPASGEFRCVRIDAELLELGDIVQGRLYRTGGAVNAGDLTIPTTAARISVPRGGTAYARLGAGAAEEWVGFTGAQDINGQMHLTGVTRGALRTAARAHPAGTGIDVPFQSTATQRGRFGTTAAAHAVGAAVIPVGVFAGVTRGAAGTTAAAHRAGAPVAIFSNVDDALRMTVAHEVGHALGLDHTPTRHIMQDGMARGAFLGNGMFDDYTPAEEAEFDAN